MDKETSLPKDEYSRTLSRLLNNPTAIQSTATIDSLNDLGHSETWIVKTVRVEANEFLFIQHINADGGQRFVLPAVVAAALVRQRDQLQTVVRKRGARKAAETRKAKGGK